MSVLGWVEEKTGVDLGPAKWLDPTYQSETLVNTAKDAYENLSGKKAAEDQLRAAEITAAEARAQREYLRQQGEIAVKDIQGGYTEATTQINKSTDDAIQILKDTYKSLLEEGGDIDKAFNKALDQITASKAAVLKDLGISADAAKKHVTDEITSALGVVKDRFKDYSDIGKWAAGQQQKLIEDPSYVQNMPGYKLGYSTGLKGLARMQATGGGAGMSGAALKSAIRYGQDYASFKVNEEFQRLDQMASRGLMADTAAANLESQLLENKGSMLSNIELTTGMKAADISQAYDVLGTNLGLSQAQMKQGLALGLGESTANLEASRGTSLSNLATWQGSSLANTRLNVASGAANLGMAAANATASGIIAAAQERMQGYMNLANIALSGAAIYAGGGAGAGVAAGAASRLLAPTITPTGIPYANPPGYSLPSYMNPSTLPNSYGGGMPTPDFIPNA